MVAAKDVNLVVAQRLPLAEAALRLLNHVSDDAFLDDVFARYRGSCFERAITFPVFVRLMAEALLGPHGSAHQAFQQAREQGTLQSTVSAAYARLATLPCPLSVGFFTEAAARLHSIGVPATDSLPASLADYQPTAIDGKKLKYVLKRLKPFRGLKGMVLGGKLLVAQDMASGLALAVEAAEDGEAADTPLVSGLLAKLRAQTHLYDYLFVADRGFCDFNTLRLLSEGRDEFLVRLHAKCKFHGDPAVPTRTGTDDQGRPFREEWGWLGGPDNPKRVRVRMITVERASGGPLVLLTSLLDADRFPAFDLLVLYRRRWGIETMFQRTVQTFDLRHLIGGTPQATVFQAIFCLLLHNVTLIVRGYVAEGAERKAESVSLHLLYGDMVRELTAWMKVIGPDATVAALATTRSITQVSEFRDYLRVLLGKIWTPRLSKAKTTKRPPKKPPRAYLKGGHSSADRILRGVHEEIPIKPRKAEGTAETRPKSS
jgi:hypothetical protein